MQEKTCLDAARADLAAKATERDRASSRLRGIDKVFAAFALAEHAHDPA